MNFIDAVFGYSKDLTALQMSCRGIAVFILALIFLRISGRRSFGLRTPLDNIIVILLGAILSRAVVGASPFVPVITCSLMIVVLHRAIAWLSAHHKGLAELLHGNRIVLYDNGQVNQSHMDRALLSQQDLEQALHNKASTESFEQIEKIYMEHNGEISIIKKK